MLQKEDYNVGLLSEIEFKKEIINEFNINNKIYEEIYKICIRINTYFSNDKSNSKILYWWRARVSKYY